MLMHGPAREHRQLAILGSLVFSSAIATLLYVARVIRSHSFAHGGMVWNLFLAWIPLLSALAAYNLAKRDRRGNWLLFGLFALLWLLFFPNAPYILTDFGDLGRRGGVPFWYDVLMYVAFAWNGTFLGLVSLYVMQGIVRRRLGTAMSWLFALVAVALSGFGVYLGRFPRYNSWDAITSPLGLLSDIWERVSNPLANTQMFAFTAIFSLLLISVYLILVAVVQFPRDVYGS